MENKTKTKSKKSVGILVGTRKGAFVLKSSNEHIKLFINEDEAHDLNSAVSEQDVVHIICALSGG